MEILISSEILCINLKFELCGFVAVIVGFSFGISDNYYGLIVPLLSEGLLADTRYFVPMMVTGIGSQMGFVS